MEVGKFYNWKGQRERLIYLGYNFSGNGYWHQFALIDSPNRVWCECLDSDLHMIEETKQAEDLPREVQDEIKRLGRGLYEIWNKAKRAEASRTERNRRKRARKAGKRK